MVVAPVVLEVWVLLPLEEEDVEDREDEEAEVEVDEVREEKSEAKLAETTTHLTGGGYCEHSVIRLT